MGIGRAARRGERNHRRRLVADNADDADGC
jgi:hypothetical protein